MFKNTDKRIKPLKNIKTFTNKAITKTKILIETLQFDYLSSILKIINSFSRTTMNMTLNEM